MVMASSEIAERMAGLRRLHVPTDHDVTFRAQLARLVQVDPSGAAKPVRYAAGLETRGIAFIEAAGGGKTTCIHCALGKSDLLNPPAGPPRYIQVPVPSPATLKSLGLEILRATGFVGVSDRATAWQIWNAVRHRLSVCGIVVLWIDEAHDLFQRKGAGETEAMLNMLKSMMQGEDAVVVVLSGTQRLSEITARDPQVDRRFTKIIPKPLIPGANEGFVEAVVEMYAKEAGLKPALADALAGRLIHASRRRFGRMVETVINAIEQAFMEGAETLTRTHFAQAWGMQEGCDWSENVFVARDWAALDPDARAAEFRAAEAAPTRRGRAR